MPGTTWSCYLVGETLCSVLKLCFFSFMSSFVGGGTVDISYWRRSCTFFDASPLMEGPWSVGEWDSWNLLVSYYGFKLESSLLGWISSFLSSESAIRRVWGEFCELGGVLLVMSLVLFRALCSKAFAFMRRSLFPDTILSAFSVIGLKKVFWDELWLSDDETWGLCVLVDLIRSLRPSTCLR